jgi:hypothetical protein
MFEPPDEDEPLYSLTSRSAMLTADDRLDAPVPRADGYLRPLFR